MAASWDLGAVLVTYADALDDDDSSRDAEAEADRLLRQPLLPSPPPPPLLLSRLPRLPRLPPLPPPCPPPPPPPPRPRLLLASLAACTLFLGAVHLALAAPFVWG
jgi:hypothetical protein